jgi:hypothetical protein
MRKPQPRLPITWRQGLTPVRAELVIEREAPGVDQGPFSGSVTHSEVSDRIEQFVSANCNETCTIA